jgi:hypothetical protein
MHAPVLAGNLFVKPLLPKVGPPETFDRSKQYAQLMMGSVASRVGVSLNWREQQWPEQSTNAALGKSTLPTEAQYKALGTQKFDADINLLLLHSLEEVGPELGHLLLRQKRAWHTFLVSITPLPDRTKDGEIYRGITAIPAPGTAEHMGIHEVSSLRDAERIRPVNPEKDGYMSFHDITKLSAEKLYTMFSLVRIRKNV